MYLYLVSGAAQPMFSVDLMGVAMQAVLHNCNYITYVGMQS